MNPLSRLALVSLTGAVTLLTACTSNPMYPEPKITEDVKTVMAMQDVGRGTPETQTLAGLFGNYVGCNPAKAHTWEEMEPGVIFFTCTPPSGGMLQFIWHKEGDEKAPVFKLKEVVVTNMADEEWSALNYRGEQAEKMLQRVRDNLPLANTL